MTFVSNQINNEKRLFTENHEYLELLGSIKENNQGLIYPKNLFYGIKYCLQSRVFLKKNDNYSAPCINLEDYALYILGVPLTNDYDYGTYHKYIVNKIDVYHIYISSMPNILEDTIREKNVCISYMHLLQAIVLNPQVMFECLSRSDLAYARTLMQIYIKFILENMNALTDLNDIQDLSNLGYVLSTTKIGHNESFSKTLQAITYIIQEYKKCTPDDNR